MRIGDLVENAGIVANVPIFRAPDLGRTGTVPADAVVEAVRPHALIGLDTGGLTEVVVTRASRTIAAKEIEKLRRRGAVGAVRARPRQGHAASNFDRVAAHACKSSRTPTASRASRASPTTRAAAASTPRSTFRQAATAARLRLTGRARATVEVVTVAHALARGEIAQDAPTS